MKRRIFLLNALLCLALSVLAVPAKRGVWCSLSLVNGTEVKAQLVGDEFLHYYVSEDGTKYVQDEATGLYREMTDEVSVKKRAMARRAAVGGRQRRVLRKAKAGNVFQGTKKGLVILAEFQDTKFKSGHDVALYERMTNEEGYSDNNALGSVKDYFKAQSNGQFNLDFDVVGTCTLANNYSYYGKNVNGDDGKASEMIVEACKWAYQKGTDFSQYDWDGDGYADQVFVLYAGIGEADNRTQPDLIWPHMYWLSSSDSKYANGLLLGNTRVDTYACANEIKADGSLDGIGCFCHEFSHCMGFPDVYGSWFGMGSYDLMDYGSYNGDSNCPAGYTAYEKAECGWMTLKDMTDVEKEKTISGVDAISNGGDAYIIKNKGYENEFYVLENRQKTGWDAEIPGSGLMISHIDYDASVWEANIPNSKEGYYDGKNVTNDHARWTLFRAGNTKDEVDINKVGVASDLYPTRLNNSLTNTSTPAATLYNKNSDGTKFMHIDIKDIAITDGKASFTLSNRKANSESVVIPDGATLLYESFDKCAGTGGNDDKWKDRIASDKTVAYDNTGWTSTGDDVYAAKECVRVGASDSNGNITTPAFTVNGTAVLSFKAGAWNAKNDGTKLNLSISSGTLSKSSVDMVKGAWTDYVVNINATGNVKVTFAAQKQRFFLDEVKVIDPSAAAGINDVEIDKATSIVGYYTLDGVKVAAPSRGVYLIRYADGSVKKVMKQ